MGCKDLLTTVRVHGNEIGTRFSGRSEKLLDRSNYGTNDESPISHPTSPAKYRCRSVLSAFGVSSASFPITLLKSRYRVLLESGILSQLLDL